MESVPSIFISYSHKDKELVVPIASYLGRLGLRVWMDTKELSVGDTIVESVSKAISNSDIYVVALSPAALSSSWVSHELNTALTLELTQGHPKVLPILIAKVDVPLAIRSRLYVDLSGPSFDAEKGKLKAAIHSHLPELKLPDRPTKTAAREMTLASVILQLRAETDKYYGGGYGDAHTKEDVEEEADELLKTLRRKANGVLLNFIPASEMDFSSPYPKFPNGQVTGSTEDVGGDFTGTFGRRAIVEVEVLNPDEKRLNQLVSSRIESLGVAKLVYTFAISPPIDGLPQLGLERLQRDYVILGWDPVNGADVELPDDVKLSVSFTDERVRLGIETKYSFQFEPRAKAFSVRNFIEELIRSR